MGTNYQYMGNSFLSSFNPESVFGGYKSLLIRVYVFFYSM